MSDAAMSAVAAATPPPPSPPQVETETTAGVAVANGQSDELAALNAIPVVDELLEARKKGDYEYATKQQDKAANGPDGIDQYELARSQVARVAKNAVGESNVQLRKDVQLAMVKASSVFINYLAATALEKTQEGGIKTMSAQHVLQAFKELGFPDHFATQLRKEYKEKIRLEAEKVSKKAQEDGDNDDAMQVDHDDEVEKAQESLAIGEESLAKLDRQPVAASTAADGNDDGESAAADDEM